jgi:hypothetical protein
MKALKSKFNSALNILYIILKKAQLNKYEHDNAPACFKRCSEFVDYKNSLNISRCSVLHGGTRKRGYVRAVSTVTLSTHRHYTNFFFNDTATTEIYTIRPVNK